MLLKKSHSQCLTCKYLPQPAGRWHPASLGWESPFWPGRPRARAGTSVLRGGKPPRASRGQHMHTDARTHTCMHTPVQACTRMHAHVHTHTSVHMHHTPAHACTHMCRHPCTPRATPRPPRAPDHPNALGSRVPGGKGASEQGLQEKRCSCSAAAQPGWEDSGPPLEESGGFAHARQAGRDKKSWVSAAPELTLPTLQHLCLRPSPALPKLSLLLRWRALRQQQSPDYFSCADPGVGIQLIPAECKKKKTNPEKMILKNSKNS